MSNAAQFNFTMRKVSRFHPPDKEVIKEMTLAFYPGAKIGVVGANGSGKSSLLKVMAGIDRDFNGEAWAEVNSNEALWRFPECIAYASQAQTLYPGELFTTGCAPDQYCPDSSVSRDQMAAFLVRTFGLL